MQAVPKKAHKRYFIEINLILFESEMRFLFVGIQIIVFLAYLKLGHSS